MIDIDIQISIYQRDHLVGQSTRVGVGDISAKSYRNPISQPFWNWISELSTVMTSLTEGYILISYDSWMTVSSSHGGGLYWLWIREEKAKTGKVLLSFHVGREESERYCEAIPHLWQAYFYHWSNWVFWCEWVSTDKGLNGDGSASKKWGEAVLGIEENVGGKSREWDLTICRQTFQRKSSI